MLGPFPGMDPFLEAPNLWDSVHPDLLFAITEDLQPQIVPRFVAAKVHSGPPEVLPQHRYVAIRDARTHEVVTVIEVLSPWNKREPGRREYREKQGHYLLSRANLVEIDLLRGGRPTVAVPEAYLPPSDYGVCIHRSRASDPESASERFELIRFGIRDVLPDVGIPLREGEPDATLHLGAVWERIYAAGGYAYQVNYTPPPPPVLTEDDAAWVKARIPT